MEKNKEEYVVDVKGKKTAVIMPIKKYKAMIRDIHDLSVVAERRDEKSFSLKSVKKRLGK